MIINSDISWRIGQVSGKVFLLNGEIYRAQESTETAAASEFYFSIELSLNQNPLTGMD